MLSALPAHWSRRRIGSAGARRPMTAGAGGVLGYWGGRCVRLHLRVRGGIPGLAGSRGLLARAAADHRDVRIIPARAGLASP